MTPRLPSAHLLRLLGSWQESSPAYRSIAERMRSLLLDGRILAGTTLPSERDLAQTLGVSRTTTTRAYDLLREQGLVRSTHGSGSVTRLPHPEVAPPRRTARPALDLTVAALPAVSGLADAYTEASEMLPALLQHDGFDDRGLLVLREAIAHRYRERGVPTTAHQVLVTLGALHALRLVVETLMGPGDAALVEAPTYRNALGAIAAVGGRPIGVPVTDDGWDLERVKSALSLRTGASRPRLAYVMPDFHNPTGRVANEAARHFLVSELIEAGTTIVSDETTLDLGIQQGPGTPLSALDPRVISIGSMNKLFWGGLRIGWIRAEPQLLCAVEQRRRSVDSGNPMIEQLVSVALLARRATAVAERSGQLRAAAEHLARSVASTLPNVSCRVPAGGLAAWLCLGAPIASEVSLACRDRGVEIPPGSAFGLDGEFEQYLRVPLTIGASDIDRFVAVLAEALSTVHARPARRGQGLERSMSREDWAVV